MPPAVKKSSTGDLIECACSRSAEFHEESGALFHREVAVDGEEAGAGSWREDASRQHTRHQYGPLPPRVPPSSTRVSPVFGIVAQNEEHAVFDEGWCPDSCSCR